MLSSRVLLVACALIALCIGAPTSFMSLPYIANMRLHPFSDQNVPLAAYSLLDGATVAIEYGFNPGFDLLMLDYEGAFPITATFSSQNGIMYLSGTAPISEYAAAIKSVVFTTSSTAGANRLITFTYGQNTTYASSTQHFYRYTFDVTSPWSVASRICGNSTYMGMQGYLATITSQREMEEVVGRSLHNVWLGATSQGGVWTWVTGPEGQENNGQGRQFWNGSTLYAGGAPTNWLAFDQWYRFTPDISQGVYLAANTPLFENVGYLRSAGPSDGIRSWICEYGGLDSAAIAATTWQYTGSVTLKFNCTLFTTSPDCANHATQGCSWSAGQCTSTDCSRFLLQSTCVSDARCNWFVNGEFGVCANTECSLYGDYQTCTADPACYYRNSTKQCLVSGCRNIVTSCVCATTTGCSWRSGRCQSDASAGCNGMDIVYLVDGTVNMSQAFERYPNGFVGVMQALSNADLALTGTVAGSPVGDAVGTRLGMLVFGRATPLFAPTSVGTGGRLTGSIPELQGDARYLQSRFTASVTTRLLGPSLQAAFNILNQVKEPRKKVIIVVSAGALDDATNIKSSTLLQSISTAGISLFGVTLRPTEPQNPDSIAAASSLAQITSKSVSVTMTNINVQVILGICGSTPLTLGPYVPKTVTLCSGYQTIVSCRKDPSCSWDYAGAACSAAACLSHCDTTSCSKDPTCQWAGSACLQKCGGSTYTASTCPASACRWDTTNGYCAPAPCTSNANEDGCIADTTTMCTFDPVNFPSGCNVTQCQAPSAASCLALNAIGGTCMYTSSCFFNPCTTSIKSRCLNYPECQWSNQKCSLNPCGQNYQTEQSCMADRNCKWVTSVTPAVCGLAPCSGLNFNDNAKESCGQDPTCYWQPASENLYNIDTCVVRPCYASSTAGDCAKYDGCVWTNSTCKDTTFVQCPAMDVVFLVEATASMSASFGRHPNGFSGIVEAIRSWSTNVPLSQFIQQPGFRLAIVGYGSPNRALQPAEGAPIFGTNFSNNVSTWTGANMILDNIAGSQSAYGSDAADNVAIFPGLSASLSLFSRLSSPNRKKILMILGHAAITDGTLSQLVDVTTNLQSLGVQIFSNVIRRFSVITPAEEVAAAFLKPLASDPVETHYSFSTIDDMQMLLESFCDPSTTIGTALAVSRDGTLPCNWLTGVTECNMQGSCYWNSTALPTCPLAGQCPNLGCVALPPALAGQFECKHCSYAGGMFSCDRSKSYAAAAGVCLKTPCSLNSLAQCSTGCQWNDATQQCQKEMCASATALECNTDSGCVWDGTACRRSVCGPLRDSAECGVFPGVGQTPQCIWNATVTPAVCMERRCGFLVTASACNQFPTNCVWEINRCSDRQCQYSDAERCNSDSSCFWDPYARLPGQTGSCNVSSTDCQVTAAYSAWTPCSANCGSGAVSYSSRAILHFAKPGGRACGTVAATLTPPGLTRVWQCNGTTISSITGGAITTWQNSCDSYCVQFSSSVSSCISDISCQWKDLQCVPRASNSCPAFAQTACDASDMCTWNSVLGLCQDAPKEQCQSSVATQCAATQGCMWRTGVNTNAVAYALGVNSILVNPGQAAVHVFPTLSINSNDIINGATVTIENGYQLGKDLLQMNLPTVGITTQWMPSSGTLVFSGASSATEYGNAIRAVTFYTSSLSSIARNVTWALGRGVLLSLNNIHFYESVASAGVTWDSAKTSCASRSYFGMSGYLVTITSGAENSIVSTKLGGTGWVSGDSLGKGSAWQWSTGPEAGTTFWMGGNVAQGGYGVLGMYNNWNPLSGEPATQSAGGFVAHVYMNQSGFWSSKLSSDTTATGYICEYGGTVTDAINVAYDFAGAAVIGVGGCLPTTMCNYHVSQSLCAADPSCFWDGYSCFVGCGGRSTINECSQNSQCSWTATVLPPVCQLDTCRPLGIDACALQPNSCAWNGTLCVPLTGCAQYRNNVTCGAVVTCQWSSGSCVTKQCNQISDADSCNAVPICTFSVLSGCTSACRYSSDVECTADSTCQWNSLTATQFFIPGGSPITLFSKGTQGPLIVDGTTDGITIRISVGFQQSLDVLSLSASSRARSAFMSTYSASAGVLQLSVANTAIVTPLQAYQFLVSSITFSTGSSLSTTRKISYVLSARTAVVGSTYYKVIAPKGITNFTSAQQACMSSTLFGLTGSVAVVNTLQISMALSQVSARGIIAAWSSGDGNWAWAGGSTFWSGTGESGKSVGNNTFAFWPFSEPKPGATFAYIGTDGSWISASQTDKSYSVVCQYGSDAVTPTTGVYSGDVLIAPSGCSAKPCTGLQQATCALRGGCRWSTFTSSCEQEVWCSVVYAPEDCGQRANCYWEYSSASCKLVPENICRLGTNSTTCAALASSGCSFSTTLMSPSGMGACVMSGCASWPTQSSCNANSNCNWYTPLVSTAPVCVARLCGYQTPTDCRADNLCQWSGSSCSPSSCGTLTAATCSSRSDCNLNAAGLCAAKVCTATTLSSCLADPTCVFTGGVCSQPLCTGQTSTSCEGAANCYYSYDPAGCQAAQCVSYSTQSLCIADRNCRWSSDAVCRQGTWVEVKAAAVLPQNVCYQEVSPNMAWFYAVLAVLALLLGLIAFRLYLAFAKGLNFFDSGRFNKKFNVHQKYTSELFDEAQSRENNMGQVSHYDDEL